jgi:hypothetical protein
MPRLMAAGCVVLCGSVVLSGCAGPQREEPGAAALGGREAEQPPAYGAIARVYNARVDRLERLYSSLEIRIKGVDRDGKAFDEQADGSLQFARDRRLSVIIRKIGEPYFNLGSNDDRYWWLDLSNKSAVVGRHALAAPGVIEGLQIPVHPLDFIDLIGILPLETPEGGNPRAEWAADRRSVRVAFDGDPGMSGAPEGVRVEWSRDRSVVLLRVPGRFGSRVEHLDAVTLRPVRVELLDDSGRLAAVSTLSNYATVGVRDDGAARPELAGRVEIEVPGARMSLRLNLGNQENREVRDRAFNFEELTGVYGITRIRDLDGGPVRAR